MIPPSLKSKKDHILEIIERSLKAKEVALSEKEYRGQGYPYCAGYMESALVQIAAILQSSPKSPEET